MSLKHDLPVDNMFKYVTSRETKSYLKLDEKTMEAFSARHLPMILKERTFPLGEIDKIFSSAWLNCNNVICGTKCNKLIVINVQSSKLWNIPMLKGTQSAPEPKRNCGIHSIAINQSQTALATGGDNPNNVAVYRLPSLEPIRIGQFHEDWVFALSWISPSLLASGSRDGSVAIWKINDHQRILRSPPLKYGLVEPISVIPKIDMVDKVRDLVYDDSSQELAVLSSNGFIHFLNIDDFSRKKACIPLPHCEENVCLALEKYTSLYAVGSLSHVSLVDPRTVSLAGSICSKDQGAGVRSVSFRDHVLTIGTGLGSILFYDLRAQKFLERQDKSPCHYKVGKGWLRKDALYRCFFWDAPDYPSAVYTHCYDASATKLFAAGGPLALGLYGNYAGLWQ